jgi:hypothetical protein
MGRIAKEELDEKGTWCASFGIVCRQAVPPPVVATAGLLAKKLASIA